METPLQWAASLFPLKKIIYNATFLLIIAYFLNLMNAIFVYFFLLLFFIKIFDNFFVAISFFTYSLRFFSLLSDTRYNRIFDVKWRLFMLYSNTWNTYNLEWKEKKNNWNKNQYWYRQIDKKKRKSRKTFSAFQHRQWRKNRRFITNHVALLLIFVYLFFFFHEPKERYGDKRKSN